MKIKSRFVAAIVTFSLALMMPLSFTSCSPEDKPEVENPDKPNVPEVLKLQTNQRILNRSRNLRHIVISC